jgi:hypothetical protein
VLYIFTLLYNQKKNSSSTKKESLIENVYKNTYHDAERSKNARESDPIVALPSLALSEEQGGNDMFCDGSCE